MINELDLLQLPNFIALGLYFIFGTKFSWNEGTHTCFTVGFVLLGRNFDFLGGYLEVNKKNDQQNLNFLKKLNQKL